MVTSEMSNQFDLAYNNITSNQAPGLSEYEKSVFLTKAQDEVIKNYFSPNSKGNNLQQGFDDSAKRQADFSGLMKTDVCTLMTTTGTNPDFTGMQIDDRSSVFSFPQDVFIVVNETIKTSDSKLLQVIPLRYDEYTRYMSKPFKRPLKNQAWRLINSGNADEKYVEILTNVEDTVGQGGYKVRYVRRPKPIILADTDGLTINGYEVRTGYTGSDEYISAVPIDCELDPILHEDILQRAVELAKIAWTSTGQDNMQAMVQAGQRSE